VLIRLDRLSRVCAHEPADMTATVEAGCTVAALQETLAAAGQWLPVDPPCPEDTTVGGLVAANLSGPLRASQGTVRDLLLGLTVIGAGGVVVRGGGKVVKNVAGYDLPKMHVGALGTLGVIVEATFKVRPRFRAEQAVVARATNLADALALAMRLRDAVEPTWLEIVHPGSLLSSAVTGTCVIAGMGGPSAWVEQAVAATLRVTDGYSTTPHVDGAAMRRSLADLMSRPAAGIVRVSALPADMIGFLPPTCDRLVRCGLAVDVTAHAASGVARVAIAERDHLPRVLDELRASVPKNGNVVVERAATAVKAGVDVWGNLGDGAALMARLKCACDPANLFAPGRLAFAA
jgi:glycolate oxidase FAD binding subunit